jgi:cysteinyl-tRNA synthetase
MTVAHLGQTFDIHGGGKDLIFPHHENEIAQSQGAFGEDSFARYWMHNGFLNFEGEKMSRSEGNVFACHQIDEAVGAEALRLFFVSHHYRSPIDFEYVASRDAAGKIVDVKFPSLEITDRRLAYFYETLQRLDGFVAPDKGGDGGAGPVLADAEALVATAREALADDFNAPVTIAALGEAAKLANKLLDEGKGIDKQVRRRTLARLAQDLRAVGAALGILHQDPATYLRGRRDRQVKKRGLDVAAIDRLLADRAAARAAKDFARADAVRNELTALGVEVLDTPQGTDWRVLESD